jgi:hypothetical protein
MILTALRLCQIDDTLSIVPRQERQERDNPAKITPHGVVGLMGVSPRGGPESAARVVAASSGGCKAARAGPGAARLGSFASDSQAPDDRILSGFNPPARSVPAPHQNAHRQGPDPAGRRFSRERAPSGR